MLNRTPDRDALGVRRGQESMRLDRKVRDHRERIVVLDDAVCTRVSRGTPAELPFVQDVRLRERIVGAQRWVLDQGRRGIERGVDAQHLSLIHI